MVGVVLVSIGSWGLYQAYTQHLHAHEHQHDGHGHPHVHVHLHDVQGLHQAPRAHAHVHAAFAVGVIHGLAGSSHILGVLPALALPLHEGIRYLLAFAVGTVIAMMGFSEALGALSRHAMRRGTNWFRGIIAGTGVIAILVGIYWLFI